MHGVGATPSREFIFIEQSRRQCCGPRHSVRSARPNLQKQATCCRSPCCWSTAPCPWPRCWPRCCCCCPGVAATARCPGPGPAASTPAWRGSSPWLPSCWTPSPPPSPSTPRTRQSGTALAIPGQLLIYNGNRIYGLVSVLQRFCSCELAVRAGPGRGLAVHAAQLQLPAPPTSPAHCTSFLQFRSRAVVQHRGSPATVTSFSEHVCGVHDYNAQ